MSTITKAFTTTVTATITAATSTSTARAPAQGGILEGLNPSIYNSSNPIILFIIQAGIIVTVCRLLHYPLSWLRQPRVIAEVIGGILLGPSVMGRVPGFTAAIFPSAAMPNLSLVANIGLVLFLFLVGLEVDLRWFASNWRPALSVSLAGMALPFGVGCAISWGLYQSFNNEPDTVPIAFPTFMLFIGVAMAITAFPVLCRILTELQLLSTPVGAVVLSAGVGNDVVGWILLALCVALVNASSGLTALWVLLTCVGYALFLAFVVRPAFLRLLKKTRALEDGPSQTIIAVTLLMTLASAFFTGVIGVHPIFGAFMAGLICPHEGGFAIAVTEKIEDLVSALFLPLYFALSGLSTDLALLDNGITWAYVVGVISVAFSAKFIGCSLAARLNGLVWRESFAIGSLMSCKGLVELIVLNIGLQAKILSSRTFTIFVVMALITTFATTPLTSALYPPWYQRKLEAWRRGEINWDGTPAADTASSFDEGTLQKLHSSKIRRLLVYLRLDNMPPLLALVSLLGGERSSVFATTHPSLDSIPRANQVETNIDQKAPVEVHGVRLVELTERNSAVMKVSEADEYVPSDPILNAFRVLAQLYNIIVSGEVSVVPESSYAETLVAKASEVSSDLLLLPWSETGSMSETPNPSAAAGSAQDKLNSSSYRAFATRALDEARTNVAVFVDHGFGGSVRATNTTSGLTRKISAASILHAAGGPRELPSAFPAPAARSHHIFMPFLGGPDDRLALRLALQLAENPAVTATLVHFRACATMSVAPKAAQTAGRTDGDDDDDSAFFATLRRSLPAGLEQRVIFDDAGDLEAADATAEVVARAHAEVSGAPSRERSDVLVVGRRAGGGGGGSCLGAVADALLEARVGASLLVAQARVSGGGAEGM